MTSHFYTLMRDFGPIVPANAIGNLESAIDERRVITVRKRRGERSRAPGLATVGYDETTPELTLCHLVTARPIARDIQKVDGLDNNEHALAVIEWALKLKAAA